MSFATGERVSFNEGTSYLRCTDHSGTDMQLHLARDDNGAPEIFRSVQGEGRNCGRLRTFIRLSGCNLHCVWCDTAYTWNWKGTGFAHERDTEKLLHKFELTTEVVRLSVDEICSLVRKAPSEGVVITGGEPLMQRVALVALIDALQRDSTPLQIEIETNGSIAPPDELAERVDLFMVSPKLGHSGNDPSVALKPEVLRRFAELESASFKFVARTRGDIETVAQLTNTFGIAAGRIYIMPEGTDAVALTTRSRDLVSTIIDHGFNYSPRLHIDLFGDTRGT